MNDLIPNPRGACSISRRLFRLAWLTIKLSPVILVVFTGATWPFARNVWHCAFKVNIEAAFQRLQPTTATDTNGETHILSGELWVPLHEVPEEMRLALVISEDERFGTRTGAIDVIAVGGALKDATLGHARGASTLWMQAVRSAGMLPGDNYARSWQRKVCEMVVASRLANHISRERLLELYFNTANFGGQIGLRAAARKFFNKSPESLTPWESYYLVGTLPAPQRYGKPDQAAQVLAKMVKKFQGAGKVDTNLGPGPDPVLTFRKGRQTPATELPLGLQAEVLRAVGPEWMDRARQAGGEDFALTLDFALQRRLQEALSAGLRTLAPQFAPDSSPNIEGAVIVLDATDGAVLACVGSRDPQRPWSCATQSERPLGSIYKGPILAAAFEGRVITAEELLADAPLDPKTVGGVPTGKPWPANADGRYLGMLCPEEAFALSRNPVFVQLGHRSRQPLDAFLRATHIGSVAPGKPAQFLGTAPTSLLHVAGAYATFVNGGEYFEPHFIEALRKSDGTLLATKTPEGKRVLRPDSAEAAFSAMRAVIRYGTASARQNDAGLAGLPGGAKTGTSSADGDGHAGDLRIIYGERGSFIVAVWIGAESGGLKRGVSSRNALPLARNLIEIARNAPSVVAVRERSRLVAKAP